MLWGGIACPLAQLGAPTWYGANREILRKVSDDTRLVVSESIGDLPGAWIEMPEASYGVGQQGR